MKSSPFDFYPRSPRGERPRTCGQGDIGKKFLSTLPARGATREALILAYKAAFLSTLPARGATETDAESGDFILFLSTLPARGATAVTSCLPRLSQLFLSTLPARGATRFAGLCHGPAAHFYPRSPRGERPPDAPGFCRLHHFYPRSPRGERRNAAEACPRRADISIHAPREGSDLNLLLRYWPPAYFYPRSPRGERPNFCLMSTGKALFLSTLPARGAT